MPQSKECPKLAKCPIFQNGILMNKITGEAYKNIYCLSDKHLECKRYLVATKLGKPVPNQVLPNAYYSVDEIIKKIEQGFWDNK